MGSGLAMTHSCLNPFDCPAHRRRMNLEVIRHLFQCIAVSREGIVNAGLLGIFMLHDALRLRRFKSPVVTTSGLPHK